jgi:soluble lytic murein transglycosylase-like protein
MQIKGKILSIIFLILGIILLIWISLLRPPQQTYGLYNGVILNPMDLQKAQATQIKYEVEFKKTPEYKLKDKVLPGDNPPRIGRLIMPRAWWEIVKDAAKKNQVCPYLVSAVMAIESRFYQFAYNKRYQCFGLMQLQKDTARNMGVTDPFDVEQNIRAGAEIIGRLFRKYNGNVLALLKKYNPTDTGAYSSEVIKAWKQGKRTDK